MQRTHVVKGVQKQLNDEVELVSLQDGAYRPIKPTLATILTHEVLYQFNVQPGLSELQFVSTLFLYRSRMAPFLLMVKFW